MQQAISKAELEIKEKRKQMCKAHMRQRYHFMGEEGWINDPNGLIVYKGKYHFFYQQNPYGSFWSEMYWAHAVSEDLIHWEYLPLALAPSEPYDEHIEGGCFSGSSVIYKDKLYLIYTGTMNNGSEFVQTQNVAWSSDGIHFEKYKENPVAVAPVGYQNANFRDPCIYKEDDTFYMICGARTGDIGRALIYQSKDLLHWEYLNILAESRGEFGYMWECPDLFKLGDKYVLMFSPMGAVDRKTVYLTGDFNKKTGKFSPLVSGEIDWGFDFYAPKSFEDSKGRRIVAAWANAWDWMPWWKDWGPTYNEGWCGHFNLLREIRLCKDGRLQFIPIDEYKEIRRDKQTEDSFKVESGQKHKITCGDGVAFELRVTFDLTQTDAECIKFLLRSDNQSEAEVCIDLKHQEMIVSREKADGWSNGVRRCPLLMENENELKVHIFSDQSSLEVFTDDYKTVQSFNDFATDAQNLNFITAINGNVAVLEMVSYGLNDVMKTKNQKNEVEIAF